MVKRKKGDQQIIDLVENNPRGAKAAKLKGSGSDEWQSYPGMVERVKLKNFMCHGELDYQPTERLNFLHGANGSGKSAVLTAIVFGLGGAAKLSNRGASNKGLIRHGERQATVEITLNNRGEEAYNPEVYGNSITIVRTVTDSSGTYKIKDHEGKVVCERKVREELGRILDTFCIQVDNPIAILNQDAAKTFLFKCDPSKLYEFFMRATQLEDVKDNYNHAAEEKAAAEELLEEKEKSLKELKKERDKWENKYKFLQSLEDRKLGLKELKRELTWTMAKSAEKELISVQNQLSKVEGKVQEIEGNLREQEEIQRTFKHQKGKIEEEIQAVGEECAEIERRSAEHKESMKVAKDSRKTLEKKLAETTRKLRQKQAEKKSVDDAIDSVRSHDEGEMKLRIERRNERIKELEGERGSHEAKMASTESHIANLAYSINQYSENDHQFRLKLNRVGGDIRQKENEVRNLEKQGDNKLALFGNSMPRLVEEVEKNQGKFKRKPIGPVGMHLKLKSNVNEKQGRLIEHELRNLLKSFLVDNFDDKRLLDQLANKCRINIQVITSKFNNKVHDISKGICRHPDFPTIYDCLECSDVNVMNTLIDHKRIEQILLVPDDRDCQNMMKDSKNVPKNCLYAYSGIFCQYYPAPSYRSYALNMDRRQQILSCSVQEMVDGLQEEIRTLKESLSGVKKQMAENQVELKKNEGERVSGEKICANLRKKIMAAQSEITDLKMEAENDKSPDISALEEDRDKIMEEIEKVENSIEKIDIEIKDGKADEAKILEIVNKVNDELQDKLRSVEPIREKLSQLEVKYGSSKNKKSEYQQRLNAYMDKIGTIREKEAKKQEKYDNQLVRAKTFSEEPPFTEENMRHADVIFRELQVSEESIKRQEQTQEPKEVVVKKYAETRRFYTEVVHQVHDMKSTIGFLDRQLRYRKKGFLEMRGAISRSSAMHFAARLQSRNFFGNLKFDHKEHLLRIMVNPNPGTNTEEVIESMRDIKTLSGGEKSFCTVSLVLSLWDDMFPPFRILDEFDVFMDSVNRRIALDLIVQYAKASRRFQYMFLTPLNLDYLRNEKDDVQVVCFEKNDG